MEQESGIKNVIKNGIRKRNEQKGMRKRRFANEKGI